MSTAIDIVAFKARATSVCLELPETLHFNDWQRIGEELEADQNSRLWHIADWAAHGERCYRRDYGEALERIYARGSLKNLAYVARNVAPERRRAALTFTHHQAVAPLEPEWQTIWLDDAITHGWTVVELRTKIAEWRGLGTALSAPALTIRAVAELRDLCVRAAERAGVDPAEWARDVLERAARAALA